MPPPLVAPSVCWLLCGVCRDACCLGLPPPLIMPLHIFALLHPPLVWLVVVLRCLAPWLLPPSRCAATPLLGFRGQQQRSRRLSGGCCLLSGTFYHSRWLQPFAVSPLVALAFCGCRCGHHCGQICGHRRAIVTFHLLPVRTPLTPARALADSSIGNMDEMKWRQQQQHQQHTDSNTNIKMFLKSHFALF